LDIYLLDTLVSGIRDFTIYENPVQIYPNPLPVNSKLTLKVDLPVISSDIWYIMIDTEGKLIKSEKIMQKNNFVDTPSQEGFYILSVLLDKHIISSERIIVKND